MKTMCLLPTSMGLLLGATLWRLTMGIGLASPPDAAIHGKVLVADESRLQSALDRGGVVTLAFDGTLVLSAPLVISKDTLLEGSGRQVTLSGNRKVRVLEVRTNVQLTLRNLIIADGRGDRGGGLLNEGGSATLLGCSFVSNRAEGGPGVPGAGPLDPANATVPDLGGVHDIQVPDGRAYVADGRMVTGHRRVPMEAFADWPTPVVPPSSLAGGSGGAARGGAVFNQGSLVASNCTFLANVASGGAGGPGGWTPAEVIDLGWTRFHSGGTQGVGGDGGWAGGGAVFQSAGFMRCLDCVFSRNLALGGAGGAAPECLAGTAGEAGPGGAAYGGAVVAESGHWEVVACALDANEAFGGAGGNVGTLGAVSPANGAKIGSLGNGGSGGIARGGAVFAHASGRMEECRIRGNRAAGAPGGTGGTAGFPDRDPQAVEDFHVGMGGAGGAAEGGALWSDGPLALQSNAWLENLAAGGVGGVGGAGTSSTLDQWQKVNYGLASRGGTGGNGGHARGGALFGRDRLEVLNSTITGNRAQGGVGGSGGSGGGSYDSHSNGGPLLGGSGGPGGTGLGGAFLNAGGLAQLRHLTVVGNGATAGAGGAGGPLRSALIPSSSGPVGASGIPPVGGGILNAGGSVALAGSIVADNGAAGNLGGPIEDIGHNLSSDSTVPLTGPGSRPNVDPRLGALGEYGGPTPTMPLLAGSPALDTADPVACPDSDQRGGRRPQGRGCDIGAVEGPGLEPPQVVLSASSAMGRVGESIRLELDLRNPNTSLTLRDLAGQVLLSPGLVLVEGSLLYTNLSLAPGASHRGTLTVRAEQPGEFAVAAEIRSALTGSRTVTSGVSLQGSRSPEILGSWARWQSGGEAILEALVIPHGPASTAWFQYGTGASLEAVSEAQRVAPGFEPQGIRVSLPAVPGGTSVRYRVVLSHAFGVLEGPLRTLLPARDLGRCQESDLRTAVAAGGYLRFACDGLVGLAAPLVIRTNVVLDSGGRDVTLSGLDRVRVLEVASGADVTLVNLTVAQGFSSTRGAGLTISDGRVQVLGGVFAGNRVTGPEGTPTSAGGAASGGAIHNDGFLLLEGTRLERNLAHGGNGRSPLAGDSDPRATSGGSALGGAIVHAAGTAVLRRCTVVSNQVAGGNGGHALLLPGSLDFAPGGDGGSARGGAVFQGGARLFVAETTFAANRATGGSAGIRNPPYMGVMNTNGVAGPASGGGIDSAGELRVVRSLLMDNVVTGGTGIPGSLETVFLIRIPRPSEPGGDARGAALAVSGSAWVGNTTFVRNTAAPGPGGTATSTNTPSPVPGLASGGGLEVAGGSVLVLNATCAGNEADVGADLGVRGGTVQLANCILAGDAAPDRVAGPVIDLGSNLASAPDAPLPSLSSRTGAAPGLLPLADHGGSTWTLALAPDSPAIDAGNDVFAPGSDQRGEPRPAGAASDIGAYEVQPAAPVHSATAILQSDGAVRLRFVAWPERRVVLEATSDWHAWHDMVTNRTDAAGVLETVVTDRLGEGWRFFRLRSEP